MYKNNYSPNGVFYEKAFNLLYLTKNYYSTNSKSKGSLLKKEKNKASNYSNLYIWNINTKQKMSVFSEEIAHSEQIQKVIFEERYAEKEQCIIFNTGANLLNYNEIPFRHPRNRLLIETYHQDSSKNHLWTCDKQGNNLKKIAVLSSGSSWHLDVGNSVVRLLKYSDTNIEIEEIAW